MPEYWRTRRRRRRREAGDMLALGMNKKRRWRRRRRRKKKKRIEEEEEEEEVLVLVVAEGRVGVRKQKDVVVVVVVGGPPLRRHSNTCVILLTRPQEHLVKPRGVHNAYTAFVKLCSDDLVMKALGRVDTRGRVLRADIPRLLTHAALEGPQAGALRGARKQEGGNRSRNV
ncbi:hypothetical protein E2C01_088053 [Portunus trituberculatus]|uniref:Uncharacterized protein n=1 Tax=Portunus trituberculatus TaxID=210409 RepID=A0A5B7J865_PORTR|nr:hypothetical protein [Portunus trituberculatus]